MKTCSIDGCNNPVWSNGKCQKHFPRTPFKKGNINYIPIKDSRFVMKKFFDTIWKSRPHMCQHCGKNLGWEPRTYMFDHILEKKKYPEYQFETDNIWLVCLECHDNKSRGIISEKYQEKINFVKTKFNES